MLDTVNWVGVAVGVIAAFFLGYLWYGPLFGKAWMRQLGKTQEQMAAEAGPALAPLMIAQLLATVITATVLAVIIDRFGRGAITGLTVGLLCAAGFAATAKLADVLFSRTSTSGRYWIESANQLVSYGLMGLIYGAMR